MMSIDEQSDKENVTVNLKTSFVKVEEKISSQEIDTLIGKVAIATFSNEKSSIVTPQSHSPAKEPQDQKSVNELQQIIHNTLEKQPNTRIKSIEKVPARVVSRIRFTRGVQTAPIAQPPSVFYPPMWMKAVVLVAAFLLGISIRVCIIDYTTNPFHHHQSWTEYYDGGRVWHLDTWIRAGSVAAGLVADESRQLGKLVRVEAIYWQQSLSRVVSVVPEPVPVFPPPKPDRVRFLPDSAAFYDFDGSLKSSPVLHTVSRASRRVLNKYYLDWRPAIDSAAFRWGFLNDLAFAAREHERIVYMKEHLPYLFEHGKSAISGSDSDSQCDSQARAPTSGDDWAESHRFDSTTLQNLAKKFNHLVTEKLEPIKSVPEKAKKLFDTCVIFLQNDVWNWVFFVQEWFEERFKNKID